MSRSPWVRCPAETRKLFYRLPSLANAAPETWAWYCGTLVAIPVYLNTLTRYCVRGQRVCPRSQDGCARKPRRWLDPRQLSGDLEQSMRNALWLGAEDILLNQLLDIFRAIPDKARHEFLYIYAE